VNDNLPIVSGEVNPRIEEKIAGGATFDRLYYQAVHYSG
jgi:hypothetical protein